MRLICVSSWFIVSLLAVVGVRADNDRALIEAAKKPDGQAVRALLKQKVDINARDGDGATALHWAARWDDLATADLLISAGADVNATDDLNATALWVAAREASAAMVDRLLRAGAKPNITLTSGETALMAASHVGNLGAVSSLIARGADVNAAELRRTQTALMWAASERHARVIEALIEAGANINARSAVRPLTVSLSHSLARNYDKSLIVEVPHGGYTPLLFAALQGDIDSARALLVGGANINDVSAAGASALVLAAHSGHTALSAFLLERGADPNAAKAGYSAVHAAILRRDVELVKALVAHRADLNAPVTKATPARRDSAYDYSLRPEMVGGTPLWLAARFADSELMRILADSGADPTFVMKDGTTIITAPLANVIRVDGEQPVGAIITEVAVLEAVKTATGLSVDVNAVNGEGDTALHIAVLRDFNSVVQFLVENGARLDIRNKKQQTPLALAITRKASNAIDVLQKAGAKQ